MVCTVDGRADDMVLSHYEYRRLLCVTLVRYIVHGLVNGRTSEERGAVWGTAQYSTVLESLCGSTVLACSRI